MALDERLHRELERAGRPADPSGVYERLIRRRERRRMLRSAQSGLLAIAVIAGSTAGVYALSTIFSNSDTRTTSAPANGLIIFSDIKVAGYDEGSAKIVDDWHLYTVDPSNGRVTRIGPDLVEEALYPTWSPDGRQIAFVGFTDTEGATPRGSIYVSNESGTQVEEIFRTAGTEQVEGLRWSPDGRRIGYQLANFGPGASSVPITERSWTIWTMAPDGSDNFQVTSTGREMHFSWSPDGTRIVFERFEPITDESQFPAAATDLYIVDADGGNEVHLTNDGVSRDPAWSPDGAQIAFSHGPRGDQHVAVIGVNGSEVRELAPRAEAATSFPYGNTIIWSPDGEVIAFTGHNDDDLCFISTLAIPEGTVRRLVSSPASESCPGQEGISWAPALAPPDRTTATQTPSVEPTTSASPSPAISHEDIGLGFPVCNLTRVTGEFAPSVTGTAYVATKVSDAGECPGIDQGALQVIAADVTGDGVADASYGPVECDPFCSAFVAADVDGDGTDELFVQNIQFSIAGLRLFEVRADPAEVFPVTVSTPGYPEGDLPPGVEPQFWIGGDGFQLDTLRCVADPAARWPRVLIQTSASQVPPDLTDSVWQATATWFALDPDGTLSIVDAGTFEEPVTEDGPTFAQDGVICGARLPPPYGVR